MVWPALIAAGASLVGGAMANSARRSESAKNRRFQERMSDTSYQRSMADMEAAGLNPMLAYQKGGATTPSGSVAQQQDIISPAVSSAMSARRLDQELDNLKADEWNKNADTDLKYTDAQKKSSEIALTNEMISTEKLRQKQIDESAKATAYENSKRKQDAKVYEGEYGDVLRTIRVLRDNLGGLIPLTKGK